jgi:hypothetical protein
MAAFAALAACLAMLVPVRELESLPAHATEAKAVLAPQPDSAQVPAGE